jgi:hypothetical protein
VTTVGSVVATGDSVVVIGTVSLGEIAMNNVLG